MPDAASYEYRIDGDLVGTSDPLITGREIRSKAGLNPASDYVLIEVGDATTRSIGLEEKVDLSVSEAIEFLSFLNDRTYGLTINERGHEWGDETITASEIRRIAKIPDEHELILDSAGDRAIEDGGSIRLKPKGVERVVSRPPTEICIFVNTRQKLVDPGKISFAELIALAFTDVPTGPNTAFTVSYRKGPGTDPEGTLIDGESIRLRKGMVFNVSATDKS